MIDEEIIEGILRAEGGYVNNPADRGGPTKWGITQQTLELWRGHYVSPEDVQHMEEWEARKIYRARYIEGPHFDALGDPNVRAAVVDCGVLHGPANATKMLQRCLGVKPDGILGPITLTAANARNGRNLAIRVRADQVAFIGRIITDNLTDNDRDGIPDNTEFAKGWLARVADRIKELT